MARSYDRRRLLARHVFALLCLAVVAVSALALSLPSSAAAATEAASRGGAAKATQVRVSISGQFRDFTTGEAIGGARITIMGGDGTVAGTAVADAAGEFALTVDTATGAQLTAVYEAAGYLREESVLSETEARLTLSPLLTPQGVKEAVLYSLPHSGVVRQPVATGSSAVTARYGLAASTLTPPATIRVYRNSLGIVQVVDFKFYVKHVLPCEWLTQWPVESLRAGAVAIKEYAWYYIAKGGKYPSLGADVTDGSADQWYDPNRSDSRTDAAVDDTWSSYLLKNGALFFLQYCGHSNLDAAYHCPLQPTCMPQWGTYYLAHDKGWSWQQIIHYYWDPMTIVPEAAPTRIQQNNTMLGYYRTWTGNANAPLASGGSFRYVNTSGASVTVKFTGSYVAWITKKSAAYGKAKVTLDGVDAGTVDLYSAKELWQQNVRQTSFATSGTHTVTISWTGIKNASATATYIGVDAFDVTGTLLQATPVAPAPPPPPPPTPTPRVDRYEQNFWRLVYGGTWYGNADAPLASDGSFRYVNTSGASVTVKFTGSYVAWITKKSLYYGKAKVTLDGVDQGTVDLYSAKELWQQKVWERTFSTSGAHTLVITWTGTKNAVAKGTNIGVDAFDIIGKLTGP